MTQDTVKALSDGELVQVIAWAEAEQKARAEKRKRETIAKIKEMARSIEVGIRIEGVRGRPAKNSTSPAAR
jgi:hypothetical protein